MRKRWLNLKNCFNILDFRLLFYPVRHPNHVNISTLVPHLEREEENSLLGKMIDEKNLIIWSICMFQSKQNATHGSAGLSRLANSAMLRTRRGSWQQRNTATITRRIKEKLDSVWALRCAATGLLTVLSLFLAALSPCGIYRITDNLFRTSVTGNIKNYSLNFHTR